MAVLQEAGVKDADLLIAVTSADEVNLLCCTTAHGLNPKLHTIAESGIRSILSRFTGCEMSSVCPWSSIRRTRQPWKWTVS